MDDDEKFDLDEPLAPPLPAAAAAPIDDEEFVAPVVNWRDLDPADAGPVWQELRSWVEWARERYDLRTLHPCWFKHPAAVEHLSALHSAWTVLFDAEDSGLGPVTFLEKLRGTAPSLERVFSGCSPKEHHSRAMNAWPSLDDDSEWGELVNVPATSS